MGNLLNIVKYKNRKLYCKDFKRYVNLDEVYSLVKSGKDIKVTNQLSGRDITNKVLLQAVYQNEEIPSYLELKNRILK